MGSALCRAYSDLVDAWLAGLLEQAEAATRGGGVALVAVGGYGRAELCPQSDLDVLLLHDGRSDVGALAERLWYPIWDEGLKLGHAVRTDPRGAGARRRRPRHGHVAAPDPAPRRRRRAHRRPGRPGARSSGRSGPSGGWPAARRGARPPRAGRRGGLPPRARPQGGPGRAARRARAALGRAGPQVLLERRPGARRPPTRRCWPPGSSCTAAPAGPAIGCCSRSRTGGRGARRGSADSLMHRLAAAGPHDRVAQRRDLAPGRGRR